jgi:magnesium-transporting ATPase (P-type)
VRSLIAAEIKFVIISGDKPETVMAIANNLKVGEEPFLATGKEFLPEYTSKGLVVFARCTPKDK